MKYIKKVEFNDSVYINESKGIDDIDYINDILFELKDDGWIVSIDYIAHRHMKNLPDNYTALSDKDYVIVIIQKEKSSTNMFGNIEYPKDSYFLFSEIEDYVYRILDAYNDRYVEMEAIIDDKPTYSLKKYYNREDSTYKPTYIEIKKDDIYELTGILGIVIKIQLTGQNLDLKNKSILENKMKYLKKYESFNSTLLNLENNIDTHLISIIKDNFKIGSNILEISCGNADDSLYLKELGYNIKCTELDHNYVENAKNLGLDCIKHDTMDKFPYDNDEFDLIYSRLGLHYFSESQLDSIFSELSRIGKSILTTVKVEEDSFKTGKVILSPQKWNEIINKYFNIEIFDVKEGLLYDKPSKWIEIFAKK